jgi:hypothetical protein
MIFNYLVLLLCCSVPWIFREEAGSGIRLNEFMEEAGIRLNELIVFDLLMYRGFSYLKLF